MSRRTASRVTVSGNNPGLALTKAIQSITKQQTSFESSVEKCKELIEATFGDIELKLESKQDELAKLDTQFEQQQKNRQVEVDLSVKEYGYTAATQILDDRGEIPVSKVEYEDLKERYEALKATKEEDVKSAVEAERKRGEQHIAAMKHTMELQNQATVATEKAKLETQVKQIEFLENTIHGLQKDLEAQRQLTKDVAQASAKSMPVYHQPMQSSR